MALKFERRYYYLRLSATDWHYIYNDCELCQACGHMENTGSVKGVLTYKKVSKSKMNISLLPGKNREIEFKWNDELEIKWERVDKNWISDIFVLDLWDFVDSSASSMLYDWKRHDLFSFQNLVYELLRPWWHGSEAYSASLSPHRI